MEFVKYVILALAVIMYLLVILFQDKKVWFTTSAAVLVILLGIIFPGNVFELPSTIVQGSTGSRIYAITHSKR